MDKINPEEISVKKLVEILKILSDSYHNDEELVSDEIYDYYFDTLKKRDPENDFFFQVGAPVREEIEEAELPFYLGGITTKKEEKEIKSWVKKYPGPYIVSEKLDGISGLLEIIDGDYKIYTRGNGDYGKDASFLKDFLKLPKIKKSKTPIYVRGEFIVKKKTFNKYLSKNYSKERSFISSIFNSKHPESKLIKYIDFIAFEKVNENIENVESFQTQFEELKKLNFSTVNYKITEKINYENLKKILEDMKKKSDYIIDGIVVTDENENENKIREKDKNPKYSFAFKIDKLFKTLVKDVIWEPNARGVLYPVVLIDEVEIDGDKIKKATGINAKFIINNNIGKGSKIMITRAGEVIPKIVIVLSKGKLIYPVWECKWNKTEVHLVLVNKDIEIVRKKRMLSFIKILEIDAVGEGIVDKFFKGGIDNLSEVYYSEIEDFMKLEGIQKKSAEKIYNNIHSVLDEKIDLATLMHSSLCFDNLGTRRFKLILDNYGEEYSKIKAKDIEKLDGFSEILSQLFVDGVKDFKNFLKLHPFIQWYIPKNNIKNDEGKIIVFTGFTNKEYKIKLEELGNIVDKNLTKKTQILVVKDKNSESSKMIKAKEMKIPILTIDEMVEKFNI